MDRPTCYAEFWPLYVAAHRLPLTRTWHFWCISAALGAGIALLPLGWWWFAVAPPVGALIGYGGSFIGHFVVEHNHPTALSHPIWSFRGGLQMYGLMWLGRMDGEVERLFAPSAAGD